MIKGWSLKRERGCPWCLEGLEPHYTFIYIYIYWQRHAQILMIKGWIYKAKASVYSCMHMGQEPPMHADHIEGKSQNPGVQTSEIRDV